MNFRVSHLENSVFLGNRLKKRYYCKIWVFRKLFFKFLYKCEFSFWNHNIFRLIFRLNHTLLISTMYEFLGWKCAPLHALRQDLADTKLFLRAMAGRLFLITHRRYLNKNIHFSLGFADFLIKLNIYQSELCTLGIEMGVFREQIDSNIARRLFLCNCCNRKCVECALIDDRSRRERDEFFVRAQRLINHRTSKNFDCGRHLKVYDKQFLIIHIFYWRLIDWLM